MQMGVAPGTYVVAVSGGVDSMVLLNLLSQQPGVQLIVAHFDHGIREDSAEDRRLVQQAAAFYDFPFVYHEGQLGADASEATARRARYAFLHQVRKASGAKAIITAHHQDDALETAILNLVRGTNHRGLGVMPERHDHLRPLMITSKQSITQYATDHDLVWREDSTNADPKYARNYIRHNVMPRLDINARRLLWQHIREARARAKDIDDAINSSLHLQSQGGRLDRDWFNQLPHSVAREMMAGWLRTKGLRDFDRRKLERLVVAAKTGKSGRQFDVLNGYRLVLTKHHLALAGAER